MDFRNVGFRHGECIWKTSEEGRGHLVDSTVGALGTEDCGHQELEGTAKLQFGAYYRHVLTEILENVLIALFAVHEWGRKGVFLKIAVCQHVDMADGESYVMGSNSLMELYFFSSILPLYALLRPATTSAVMSRPLSA